MIYGYIRVSTMGQSVKGNSPEEQELAISTPYPGATLVKEIMSGAKERPLFLKLMEEMQRGDLLVVTKLDRFCRTTKEGLGYIDTLQERGIKVHILNMGLIEDTPVGRLIATQLLAFAEFERAMILERTSAGREYKKRTDPNYKEGRKKLEICPELFREIKEKVDNKEITVVEAVARLGISRRSWYNLIEQCA